MFCDRNVNSKINTLHYHALKIVYRDNVSSFDELLIKDKSSRVHHKNIHFLAIEMFKVKLGIGPPFMAEIFRKRKIASHSAVSGLRNQTDFYNYNNPKTVYYGSETLRSLGPEIWNILPSNIKNSTDLVAFKTILKDGFSLSVHADYANSTSLA